MSVLPLKTWLAGEILTAADLNAEFLNILNNGQLVGFPRTQSADFDGQTLVLDTDGDSSIRADTDDQIDVNLGGSDIFKFTTTQLEILSRRVLTVDDLLPLGASSVIPKVNQARADAMALGDGSMWLESQLYTTQ